MSVGAAEAKGTDSSQGRAIMAWPGCQGRLHAQWKFIKGNIGIGLAIMKTWRDRAVLERQSYLNQPGDPSCRLKVSNVCLNRAYQTGIVCQSR